MGLRVFLSDLAGTKYGLLWGGAQQNVLLCGIFSGSLSSFRLVVLLIEHQPSFVDFSKTIGVSPKDRFLRATSAACDRIRYYSYRDLFFS